MLKTGKENYAQIPIPDDRLLAAIGKGIHKDRVRCRKKAFRNLFTAAACFVFLAFGCANISLIYTYASEIPIVKNFVQAMRIGDGGTQMEDATIYVRSDENSITIFFSTEGRTADKVMSYSAEYYREPPRLQLTFQNMNEEMFLKLEEKLTDMKAVKEVCRISSEQVQELTFEIVLNELYNYELMEFSKPGSLTLRFYQDAYYTEEERKQLD